MNEFILKVSALCNRSSSNLDINSNSWYCTFLFKYSFGGIAKLTLEFRTEYLDVCTLFLLYIVNLYNMTLNHINNFSIHYNTLLIVVIDIYAVCRCCLPTPMTLASGGSPMFPLVVHQPASPSIWPAVQSLRRGLSTNPGATMWCVCGCNWRDDVCRVCGYYRGGIVVMGVFWRRLSVSMIWGWEICLFWAGQGCDEWGGEVSLQSC